MKKADFEALYTSVLEMDAIIRDKRRAGRVTAFRETEVKLIREKTGLSQARFATLIGVSNRTVENWEQGRRHPTGPAKALLRLVEHDPEYAMRTLSRK